MDTTILDYIQSLLKDTLPIMKFLSFIGNGEFYLIFLIILLWFVNYEKVINLTVFIVIAALLTEIIKSFVHSPRPYHVDEGLKFIKDYGMPSGHATIATVFYLYVSKFIKNKYFKMIPFIFIFLIGLSRIVLNKHYPSQVIIGLLLGIILYYYFVKIESKYTFNIFYILAILVILIITTLNVKNNNDLGIYNLKHIYQLSGLLTGLVIGFKYFNNCKVDVRANIKTNMLKGIVFLVNLICFIGFKLLLKVVFNSYSIFWLMSLFCIYMMFAYSLCNICPKYFIKKNLMKVRI